MPAADLAPFVDRLWGWRLPAGTLLPLLLPGTGSECFVHLAQAPRLEDGAQLPDAYVVSPRRHYRRIQAQGPVSFIAIRFKSGQLRHFTAHPLAECEGRILPLAELWGGAGERLVERLQRCSASRVIEVLEQFLRGQLASNGRSQERLEDALIQHLYYAQNQPLTQVAEQFGSSMRHLERRFHKAFGLGPKHFARLARLQHCLRDMALYPQRPLVTVALAHGFSDQSHFIHEAQGLTGLAPGSLAQRLQERPHFYHPPSRLPDPGY